MDEEREKLKQEIKKELRKENIKIFIILTVCILAIGGIIFTMNIIQKDTYNDNSNINRSNQEVKEISKEEFRKYIKQVDITTENWKDFFEINYNIVENKDIFGDVTKSYYEFFMSLNETYLDIGELVDTALQIRLISIGGASTVSFESISKSNSFITKDFGYPEPVIHTIDDFECIKAKGKLFYLDNIPDEYWNNTGDEKFIQIEGGELYKYHHEGYEKYLKDFIEDKKKGGRLLLPLYIIYSHNNHSYHCSSY